MSIKAIVFDYGEVICFAPVDTVREELARLAGLPVEEFDALRWRYRPEFDRGTLNGREYYRLVTTKAGLSLPDAALDKMAETDVAGWTRMDEGTVSLMRDIKAAGFKLGILSNMPWDFLTMARRTGLPVLKLFDAAIFSCELGVIKPEPAIYQALIAAVGCDPAEIVFFDDVKANVDGALALGIKAYLWKDADTARSELLGLGISVQRG
ncbi:haloacid dehalogenase [Spirochaetia bacterium]|nr:haloacid dehalogenase [Spirochaetia bacterium]